MKHHIKTEFTLTEHRNQPLFIYSRTDRHTTADDEPRKSRKPSNLKKMKLKSQCKNERKVVQEHKRGFGVKTSQPCSEMVVTDWASC